MRAMPRRFRGVSACKACAPGDHRPAVHRASRTLPYQSFPFEFQQWVGIDKTQIEHSEPDLSLKGERPADVHVRSLTGPTRARATWSTGRTALVESVRRLLTEISLPSHYHFREESKIDHDVIADALQLCTQLIGGQACGKNDDGLCRNSGSPVMLPGRTSVCSSSTRTRWRARARRHPLEQCLGGCTVRLRCTCRP